MLEHPSEEAAQAHSGLVLASLERGMLDVHALVRSHMNFCREHEREVPRAEQLPWALSAIRPAHLEAASVWLGPLAGAPAQEISNSVAIPMHFSDALVWIDACVALAAARATSRESHSSALTAPSPIHLSARERQALVASQQVARFPRIHLCPLFSPSSGRARGQARAKKLLDTLEQKKLTTRPVTLWIGPRSFVDALSPTLRDVGFALQHAGPAALARAGVAVSPRASPSQILRLLEAAAPEVAAERIAHEKRCGIETASLGDIKATLIAVERLDAKACAEQAAAWLLAGQKQKKLVISLPWDLPKATSCIVTPLFEAQGFIDVICARLPFQNILICPQSEGEEEEPGKSLNELRPEILLGGNRDLASAKIVDVEPKSQGKSSIGQRGCEQKWLEQLFNHLSSML